MVTMQRRKFITLCSAFGLGSALSMLPSYAQAQNSLTIRWFGHLAFEFTGGGLRLFTHPFRSAGCTAGMRLPSQINADYVMISSRLLDEGYIENLPPETKVLAEAGTYTIKGTNFQGIATPHDRLDGRRFGQNVMWRWEQAGIRLLHMGGAAAPLTSDQRILIGRPDILILPVGGSDKAYNAQEAWQVAQSLNPRIIIPAYYRTSKAADTCGQKGLDEFLELAPKDKTQRVKTPNYSLRASDLPETTVVRILPLTT
jgi:L-ascorbate metabolism protein UlaG (beta-lactamase superfamily)